MATVAAAGVAIFVAGCGSEDFENKARPPVRLQLSGVIQNDKVTVSPNRDLGAGPFEITISNQTGQRHTRAGRSPSRRSRSTPATRSRSSARSTRAPTR
jgi:hypothetical protein